MLYSACTTQQGERCLKRGAGSGREAEAWQEQTPIATDGAPAMLGKNNGFTNMFICKLREDGADPLPLQFHCINHQQNLGAKTMNHEPWTTRWSMLQASSKQRRYFSNKKGLKRWQFKTFLEDIHTEHGDVPYYVRWLSRKKLIMRAYNLHMQIFRFCHSKEKIYPNSRTMAFWMIWLSW